MHVHILGIGGTFMGSLARLCVSAGMTVTGQDKAVYPPMSNQLDSLNIPITLSYDFNDLPKNVDLIIIGNVMTRGMPIIEYILNNRLAFISGPEFLSNFLLKDRHAIVVAGTHGKTTTTSMLAWILEYAGLHPSFLIGGVPNNFSDSSRLTDADYFVIEGDEYDCAFFDKRSKFIHYRPTTLILNNLEFDHADIFRDLPAIEDQFHHLVRLVPANGKIIYNAEDANLQRVLDRGVWSKLLSFGQSVGDLSVDKLKKELNELPIIGQHNQSNALAAILVASELGVNVAKSFAALHKFTGVARRLDRLYGSDSLTIYNDFAHHPTAMSKTINALKEQLPDDTILTVAVDIASNTMRQGVHQNELNKALADADRVLFYHNCKLHWQPNKLSVTSGVFSDIQALILDIKSNLVGKDCLLLLSNSAFGGIYKDISLITNN